MDNKRLAHEWAAQKEPSGRGSNMYFEGPTIYSYGKHFPIATIDGHTVFFTTRRYSISTAAHISYALSAVSHKHIIYVDRVPVKNYSDKSLAKQPDIIEVHDANFVNWESVLGGMFSDLGKPRIRNIDSRIKSITDTASQIKEYCVYFNIKPKGELKRLLKEATSDSMVSNTQAAVKRLKDGRDRKIAAANKLYKKYVDAWRDFKEYGVGQKVESTFVEISFLMGTTRLRYNNQQKYVETSKGINIPVPIAKRAYNQLERYMGEVHAIHIPVLNWTITNSGKEYINAGCHTIPNEDIYYIADLLGWRKKERSAA